MPDIASTVAFEKDLCDLILVKTGQEDFKHTNWSDDDLEPLRRKIRDFYRLQQKGKCAYCYQNVSLQSALNCHVEHIVPKSLYPEFMFTERNLCVVCADCNEIKREQETCGEIEDTLKNGAFRKQYPRSSGAFKIVHPHFDKYEEHILILNGFYVDRSVKGHFTIGACRLNRKLHEFGWEKAITDDDEVSQVMNAFLNTDDSMKRHDALTKLKKLLIEN